MDCANSPLDELCAQLQRFMIRQMQDWIAYSRVEIDQAQLLVLHAAWQMDVQGNATAHIDVAAIKLV